LWRSTLARTGAALASGACAVGWGAPLGLPAARARSPPRLALNPIPGPARFTPALGAYYEEQGAAKEVEVVFVTADHDNEGFEEYYAEMPWAAVPFNFDDREAISDKFQVVRFAEARDRSGAAPFAPRAHPPTTPPPRSPPQEGIPRVVILNATTGEVVNDNARMKIVEGKKLAGLF
jgi:hypothetical protein